MVDSIYYMISKLIKNRIVKIVPSFTQRYNGHTYVTILNW